MSLGGYDIATVLTLAILTATAIREFRLLRANRRKVIAESSDLSTQAADRMLKHWEQDNQRLRADVQRLEAQQDELEARIGQLVQRNEQLERLLREHGVPFPASS